MTLIFNTGIYLLLYHQWTGKGTEKNKIKILKNKNQIKSLKKKTN